MWVRQVAGWTVIAAGSGLAAISGVLAYHGFEAMISIPFAGWIGPCVAASLIGLGIAVESEIRARRWIGAAVLGALLIGAGLLDRHSGELALAAKVEAAHQADADRLAAWTTAKEAKATAEAVIADREIKLATLQGDDVVKAQRVLGVTPDGEWGPETTAAALALAAGFRAEIDAARADVRKHTDVVAKGAPASTAPFSLHDAALYASLITLLSIVLAFAGSYVAHGLGRNFEKELDEAEGAMDVLEAEVFDLATWMEQRKAA